MNYIQNLLNIGRIICFYAINIIDLITHHQVNNHY